MVERAPSCIIEGCTGVGRAHSVMLIPLIPTQQHPSLCLNANPWVQYLPLCMKLRYCLLKIATSLLNPHCYDGYQPWRPDCRFNCCRLILPTKSLIRAPSQPCHKLPELLRIGKLPLHFFTVGTSSRQHSTKITVPFQPTYFCFPNKIDCGSHLVRYLVYSF